jgi:hypothetical protein
MKLSNFAKIIITSCLALALAGSSFAADSHKANFQISEAVQVNGTQLAPGDYVARWNGEGPDVQVNITRNGKSLATVPARLVQLDQKSNGDSTECRKSGNSKELSALQFAGKKYALEIGTGAGSSATASVK